MRKIKRINVKNHLKMKTSEMKFLITVTLTSAVIKLT